MMDEEEEEDEEDDEEGYGSDEVLGDEMWDDGLDGMPGARRPRGAVAAAAAAEAEAGPGNGLAAQLRPALLLCCPGLVLLPRGLRPCCRAASQVRGRKRTGRRLPQAAPGQPAPSACRRSSALRRADAARPRPNAALTGGRRGRMAALPPLPRGAGGLLLDDLDAGPGAMLLDLANGAGAGAGFGALREMLGAARTEIVGRNSVGQRFRCAPGGGGLGGLPGAGVGGASSAGGAVAWWDSRAARAAGGGGALPRRGGEGRAALPAWPRFAAGTGS
jgi:hypothetical protein